MDEKLFTPRQLAAYLETSVSALSQYRALGIGDFFWTIIKYSQTVIKTKQMMAICVLC